jgi:hypothetical protein
MKKGRIDDPALFCQRTIKVRHREPTGYAARETSRRVSKPALAFAQSTIRISIKSGFSPWQPMCARKFAPP